MLAQILNLDRQIFIYINHLPHTPLLNDIFLFFSLVGVYGVIWIILSFILFITDKIKNQKEILTLLLSIFMELFVVELLMKNYFARVRPEYVFKNIIKVLSISSTYSFPSSHAALGFASAYVLAANRRKYQLLFYGLATLIAFSRIYLGKHYPSDVLTGAVIGVVTGWVSVKITKSIKMKEYF